MSTPWAIWSTFNDHWDLDHPFERLLVDTTVPPDPAAVTWINPRLQPEAADE